MSVTNVNDTTFETEVLNSDKAVIVDFWAEWCGPCRQIAPTLEDLASEYQDKIKVVKVNVDENPEVPAKYGIRSIPTLILFKQGQVEATSVGAQPKAKLVESFKLETL